MEIRHVAYTPAKPVAGQADKPDAPVNAPAAVAKPAAAPETADAVHQPARAADIERTKQAVQDIERMMKLFSQNLEFSMDDAGNRAVMRIVDQETKEVIRQVPSKEAMEIARALEKIQSMLLIQGTKITLKEGSE